MEGESGVGRSWWEWEWVEGESKSESGAGGGRWVGVRVGAV